MHKEFKLNTPGLMGGSELVVMAPIKPGFVPALDSVTYKTRAKMLLRALHSGRKTSHEFQLFRALSDAVERIGVIHTVRVAVLEPEDKIMLSVNVDGSYEAYVRVIWQKSARLLDLIFCNTVDHVTGWDHSYEEWAAWLRRVQVEIPFFYAPPNLTAPDQTYLRMLERYARRDGANDLAATQIAIPSAEQIAWDLVRKEVDPQNGPQAQTPPSVVGSREAIRQGVQGLVGLYRLADLYPPGTPDGVVLHRAARELLPEFHRMQQMVDEYGDVIDDAARRFPEQLRWLERDAEPLPAVRVPPPLPLENPKLPAAAQAGILKGYKDVTDGLLCLVGLDDAQAAADFLAACPATSQGQSHALAQGAARWNVAFSFEGLRRCGLPDTLLDELPLEFRQGMEQRAGILGDVRGNHPRRWSLPLRNWPQAVQDPDWVAAPDHARITMEAVHAVVQVRMGPNAENSGPGADLRPQLAQLMLGLFAKCPHARPLSVQWMQRLGTPNSKGETREHFGYLDGQSQPELAPRADTIFYPNQVHLGETLLGYDNAADRAPDLGVLRDLLLDGSYLVIRKLRQYPKALEAAVAAVVAQEAGRLPTLTRDVVLAKLMGRWHADSGAQAGKPLVTHATPRTNDFNYQGDPQGSQCPFSAHIRRANPRTLFSQDVGDLQPLPGARPPRLMRRGMAYGKPGQEDCGLMFMAYNTSLAEQFETVQRWMTGGNSSGAYSGANDPFLGVPESGRARSFRFEHEGRTVRMVLDGNDALGEDPRPLVTLEWGGYFFAPSIRALGSLQHSAQHAAGAAAKMTTPATAAAAPAAEWPWNVAEGAATIARLQALERQNRDAAAAAWKAALEDPGAQSTFLSASVWAAIRARHGGVLRVPYGVLVADRRWVDEVLADPNQRYSVQGYQQRLQATLGAIYLGLDAHTDGQYEAQSAACNNAIMALTYEDGFKAAREATHRSLAAFVQDSMGHALFNRERSWELNLDLRELLDAVLAELCEKWFGVHSRTGEFQTGGYQWNWQDGEPPLVPGHFNAPSRYTFQPAPGPLVEDVAVRHGRSLARAMEQFLARHWNDIQAPITRAVLQQSPPPSMSLAARTVTGAIMGFVPTTDGSVRRVVAEWMRNGTLWSLRAKTAADSLALLQDARRELLGPLKAAMQARPVPELIWRTATRRHELGQGAQAVHVQVGEPVILALVSATQQGLENDQSDVSPIFGGNRHAPSNPPTHACPAYPAAMGVMLGLLSAIVDTPQALRPGPALGVLSMGGSLPAQAPMDSAPPPPPGSVQSEAATPQGTVLTWGDSWFSNPYPQPDQGQWDFAVFLRERGYTIAREPLRARAGAALSEMAAIAAHDPDSFYSDVRRALLDHHQRGTPLPRAILLDGGGNDVHRGRTAEEAWLSKMLNAKGSTDGHGQPLPIFKEQVVREFIDGVLAQHWHVILDQLTGITQGRIPILLHGYDHPIPDGRSYGSDWLKHCITVARGYDAAADGPAIMKTLINRLNDMLSRVSASYAGKLRVHHVRLTGTLAAQPGFALNHATYWVNELHPNVHGFRALAKVMQGAIDQWGNPKSQGKANGSSNPG